MPPWRGRSLGGVLVDPAPLDRLFECGGQDGMRPADGVIGQALGQVAIERVQFPGRQLSERQRPWKPRRRVPVLSMVD